MRKHQGLTHHGYHAEDKPARGEGREACHWHGGADSRGDDARQIALPRWLRRREGGRWYPAH
eukprot:5185612-Pleurochrysis_carterae.AAC.1